MNGIVSVARNASRAIFIKCSERDFSDSMALGANLQDLQPLSYAPIVQRQIGRQ
jgi:hypothetical protein